MELLLILEVFQLLGPVCSHHFLIVAESRVIQLHGESFFEVFFGDELAEQVGDLLVEVVLENLLNHHRQVLLNRQHLRLQKVRLVRGLVEDEALLLDLAEHLLLQHAFHAFDIFEARIVVLAYVVQLVDEQVVFLLQEV